MVWQTISDEKLLKTKCHFSNDTEVTQWYAIAYEILILTYGPEWIRDNYNPKSNKLNLFFQNLTEFEHQDKMIVLGHLLYKLKDCKGFDELIDRYKFKDLNGLLWELEAAERFYVANYEVEFNIGNMLKGNDFDLIVIKDDITFFVEAKNRVADINDEKSISNALIKARRQLPKKGNGIIIISVPFDVTIKNFAELTITKIIEDFLRNTTRIKYIILQWYELEKLEPGGLAKYVIFREIANKKNTNLPVKLLEIGKPFVFIPSFWKQ